MQKRFKIYVDLDVRFSAAGKMKPLILYWEDGSAYEIQRVLDVRPAASLKAGGAGIRYTCLINGQEKYLFFEEDKWFVEAKD